jgi:hypothetical protein
VNRRRALQALILVGAGLLALGLLRRATWLTQAVATWLRPRLDVSSPTGTLAEGERETIVAFGEVLTTGRRLSPAERQSYSDYIDEQTMSTPGQLALYRMTTRRLDRLARGRFSALDIRDRAALMVRHDLCSYHVSTFECLQPWRRQELAVRALAASSLIVGYYRCAAGWAVVGYETFPGRCGDPRRYTRAEA